MDRVRFGRALGYGTRHAAKTLMHVVEAATAPAPAKGEPTSKRKPALRTGLPRSATVRQAGSHARAVGKSVWTPMARFSSVLWLQVTGTFFFLIAGYFSQGLWKDRGVVRLGLHSSETGKFALHAAAFLVFAYFAVSNFVRAWRRERR